MYYLSYHLTCTAYSSFSSSKKLRPFRLHSTRCHSCPSRHVGLRLSWSPTLPALLHAVFLSAPTFRGTYAYSMRRTRTIFPSKSPVHAALHSTLLAAEFSVQWPGGACPIPSNSFRIFVCGRPRTDLVQINWLLPPIQGGGRGSASPFC